MSGLAVADTDSELTMVNMCQNAKVSNVGRVSLQCNDLIQAGVSHGEHLKQMATRNVQDGSVRC